MLKFPLLDHQLLSLLLPFASQKGFTALICAAEKGFVAEVQELLEAKAAINLKDKVRLT